MKKAILTFVSVVILSALPVAGRAAEGPATVGEPEPREIVQPRQRISGWIVVTAEETAIREGPSPQYEVIETAQRGEEFEVEGRVRGWYFIRFDETENGWIASRDVARTDRRRPPPDPYPYEYEYPYGYPYYYPFYFGWEFHYYDDDYYRYRRYDRRQRDYDDRRHRRERVVPPPRPREHRVVPPPIPPPGIIPPGVVPRPFRRHR